MAPTVNIPAPFPSSDLINFAQELVRVKSFSGQEEDVIRFIARKMQTLGYDEVIIDSMGNLLGRIGGGEKSILFDSHVDTVTVNDESNWTVPPFAGEIVDGKLYGRGSVDMKSAVAASVYAGALAKQHGLLEDKTVYVSCGVFEEDCDGENLKHLFKERNLKPDRVVICEPSSNQICLGHKGKAQVLITTHGISAHGAAPEKGLNAVYEMAEIIQRVEEKNLSFVELNGMRPTLVLSRISSTSASLNAVPSECEIYLDRRMVPGETAEGIRQEMDQLIRGKKASWKLGTLKRRSWTGMDFQYEPLHLAWRIDLDHPLARASQAAYAATFGREPEGYAFWDFSTNAVTPVSMGIATIGFGPGDAKQAHMVDENCPVDDIVNACAYYFNLIRNI